MDDNLVEEKLSMDDRLIKLEKRIKYLVLEARLDCDCNKCLRLKDQFDKFKTEIDRAYPWLDHDPVPPRPPKSELPVFPSKTLPETPSPHILPKHF
jgi:hypothetical protein